MSSIQSIDHSTVSAERILSKLNGVTGKAQNRSSAQITPEPPENTVLSASGADNGSSPGVPRSHPPEAADNLLARMPAQDDGKLTQPKEVHLPPAPPGQLAVMLLSMINQTGSSSGLPASNKHTLDVMA